MSQLAKAVLASDTGERKLLDGKFTPLFQDVFSMKEYVLEDPVECAKIYQIGVTLGNKAAVSEFETLKHGDALTDAIERTRRSIVEAVFGEFRQDFRLLEGAIYDRDFLTARNLLVQLEDKMFSTK